MNRPAPPRPVHIARQAGPDRVFRMVLAIGLAVLGLWVVIAALVTPAKIERLEIENPTRFDVHVTVSGSDGSSILLGTVSRQDARSFQDVIDQGDDWTFAFDAQGVSGGAMTVSRSELLESGWTLRIPDRVAGELLGRGAPLPP